MFEGHLCLYLTHRLGDPELWPTQNLGDSIAIQKGFVRQQWLSTGGDPPLPRDIWLSHAFGCHNQGEGVPPAGTGERPGSHEAQDSPLTAESSPAQTERADSDASCPANAQLLGSETCGNLTSNMEYPSSSLLRLWGS